MTDYKQEQRDEIEAIESIYSEEIVIISENPHRWEVESNALKLIDNCRFAIPVKTEDYDEDSGEGMYVLLRFTFPDSYPDCGPELEFEETEGLEENKLSELRASIDTVVEENLGMAMIFSIISSSIEWLGDANDKMKEEAEEAIRRKKEEDEEEERKKLEGTKVTIESFLAWKAEFDAEMRAKKGIKELTKKEKEKKTGKQMFMTDATLNQSDVKFLAETGDVAVTVDESLFEDLDDLDLDEDSDDPDWAPGAEISD